MDVTWRRDRHDNSCLKLTLRIVTEQALTNSLPSQSYNNTAAQSLVDQYVNITNKQLENTGTSNPQGVLEDATQYGLASAVYVVSLVVSRFALILPSLSWVSIRWITQLHDSTMIQLCAPCQHHIISARPRNPPVLHLPCLKEGLLHQCPTSSAGRDSAGAEWSRRRGSPDCSLLPGMARLCDWQ